MSLDKKINKKLFIINKQPCKFFMGLEFQRKEFTIWCKKIESYGGIIFNEVDSNTVNLTKLKDSHENDDNLMWYDSQFIDDCIEKNKFLDIRKYRINKPSRAQIKRERIALAEAAKNLPEKSSPPAPSPPPEPQDKSSTIEQNSPNKLEMQAKVVLERIDEKNLQKMLEKKSENLKNQETNLAEKTSRKGIKVVNIETLLSFPYKPLITSPKEKESEDKNQVISSGNKETLEATTSKNDSEKISKLDCVESPPRKNNVDDLTQSIDSPTRPQQLATNFDDSEGEIVITPVIVKEKKMKKSKRSPKKKTKLSDSNSQCGERILYGFRVREIPIRESSSSEDEFDNETVIARPFSSILPRKTSEKMSEKILTDDEEDSEESSQSGDEDNPPAVSLPCKKKTLFKTVYADIAKK